MIALPSGRVWTTQGAALEHFKQMLHRFADNAVDEDRADLDDLLASLERYDAVIIGGPSKIGQGVDYLFRRQNSGEGYSTPGFWINRVDGTQTDFSYLGAVKDFPAPGTSDPLLNDPAAEIGFDLTFLGILDHLTSEACIERQFNPPLIESLYRSH